MNTTITKETSLIESMYKREIIAGIMGGIIVFVIVVAVYLYNGLMYKKIKRAIN
jgi:ABC-type multidrug transport system permease subunit